jgi:hypothetical protein
MSASNPPPDPLVNGVLCRRDIPYLSDASINVLTVYNIDGDKDHSECMNALAQAGIYVVADVIGGGGGTGYTWDQQKFDFKIGIIDSLANYTNLLGLRMVAEDQQPTDVLYFRAAFRDMRAHISDVWQRNIPIVLVVIPQETDFIDHMWCHDDGADIVHAWIGEDVVNCTTYKNIADAVDFAKTMSIPSVVDGMRCQLQSSDDDNRDFEFIYDVYSDQGAASLSGGLLQTYYGNWNDSLTWGLSSLKMHSSQRMANLRTAIMGKQYRSDSGNAIAPLLGGAHLSSVLAAVKPSFTEAAQYQPTATPKPCPTGSKWAFSSVLSPKVYEPLCSCMLDTLRCTAKLDAIETLSEQDFDIALFTIWVLPKTPRWEHTGRIGMPASPSLTIVLPDAVCVIGRLSTPGPQTNPSTAIASASLMARLSSATHDQSHRAIASS